MSEYCGFPGSTLASKYRKQMALAIYQYLNPKKVTVYVFNDNYETGTVLTSDMLTSIKCDAGIVVAGKSTGTTTRFVTGENIKEVLETGDSIRMDVADGMPL